MTYTYRGIRMAVRKPRLSTMYVANAPEIALTVFGMTLGAARRNLECAIDRALDANYLVQTYPTKGTS